MKKRKQRGQEFAIDSSARMNQMIAGIMILGIFVQEHPRYIITIIGTFLYLIFAIVALYLCGRE